MDDIREFFTKLFNPDGWPARWHCGMWTPFHGWLYIISNIFIALAYFSIPVILFYLIRKTKNKLPFQRIFWLFLIFILACGFTHVFDALMFWHPIYRAAAVMLFITAVVSCAAVIGLYKIIPEALLLKSPEALEKIINERTEELVKTNQFLSATNAQLKEAQALSEKLLKEKDEFISVASHELKTPVTSLKAYTQVLTRQSVNEDGAKKDMFIKMDTQINKLTKLINDLLDTTKLQNGSLAYQKEEIRLDKIIEDICEEIQMTTSHTIIQEKTEITVIGDKSRISQVITNLLTNAIKFSPDAGEIIISLTRKETM